MKYFDLHCDTAYECYKTCQCLAKNGLAVSFEKGSAFDCWVQCFAVWIKDDIENPYLLYRNVVEDFKAKISHAPENLRHLLTVEGGTVLEDRIERLERLKADGVKALTLTWNGNNLIAGGADTDAPLTDYGREVIDGLNSCKIACDLSHLNERSFFAALERAEFPIATHSNLREVCEHKRNLSFAQAKALFERGGIMGLCFYPPFVGEDVFEGLYRNIFTLCDMGYEDFIAIGSDFDGGKMDIRLDCIAKIPSFFTYLAQKGFKKSLLDKIFYNNAEKFFVSL